MVDVEQKNGASRLSFGDVCCGAVEKYVMILMMRLSSSLRGSVSVVSRVNPKMEYTMREGV